MGQNQTILEFNLLNNWLYLHETCCSQISCVYNVYFSLRSEIKAVQSDQPRALKAFNRFLYFLNDFKNIVHQIKSLNETYEKLAYMFYLFLIDFKIFTIEILSQFFNI